MRQGNVTIHYIGHDESGNDLVKCVRPRFRAQGRGGTVAAMHQANRAVNRLVMTVRRSGRRCETSAV